MSTERKNKINKAYLKNFTKFVEERYVLIQNAPAIKKNIQETVNHINETVNTYIQKLNVKIHDRQIPYITLCIKYDYDIPDDTRIFLHDDYTSTEYETKIKEHATENIGKTITHLLEFLLAAGYKELSISQVGCDAKLVVAHEFFECAVTDILLDIAMFNSFSFLRNLQIKDKHAFTSKKLNYYKQNKDSMTIFYDHKEIDNLYYSFAFSARNSKSSLSIEKYIEYWDDFISKEYKDYTHKELSVAKQLKNYYRDYGEIGQNFYKKFYNMDKGAYILMRINADHTEDYHELICNLFHIKSYRTRQTLIKPISQFDTYTKLFENLDVSAFKVVNK